jgi:hypothetical protein
LLHRALRRVLEGCFMGANSAPLLHACFADWHCREPLWLGESGRGPWILLDGKLETLEEPLGVAAQSQASDPS